MLLSEIKKYLSKVAVIIIFGLTATCVYQHRHIKQIDRDLGRITNNYRAYQDLTSRLDNENRTLQLQINELRYSNDSLLEYANQVKEQLKIKDKHLQQVQVINTEIRDTITQVIPRQIDFDTELKLNPLTTITVSRKDSILTASLDLKNSQVLFIEEKKEYRRRYKNWFQRFIHLDFKKDRVRHYQIENSNELIKVTDTRVIEVTD